MEVRRKAGKADRIVMHVQAGKSQNRSEERST